MQRFVRRLSLDSSMAPGKEVAAKTIQNELRKNASAELAVSSPEGILKADEGRAERKGLAVSFAGADGATFGEFVLSLNICSASNLQLLLKQSSDLAMWCSVGVRGGDRLFTSVAHPDDHNVWVWDNAFDISLFSLSDTISVKIFNNPDFHLSNLVHTITFPAADFQSPTPVTHTHHLPHRAALSFTACTRSKSHRRRASMDRRKQALLRTPPLNDDANEDEGRESAASGSGGGRRRRRRKPRSASPRASPREGGAGEGSGTIRQWLDRHRAARAGADEHKGVAKGRPQVIWADPDQWLQRAHSQGDDSRNENDENDEDDDEDEDNDECVLRRTVSDSQALSLPTTANGGTRREGRGDGGSRRGRRARRASQGDCHVAPGADRLLKLPTPERRRGEGKRRRRASVEVVLFPEPRVFSPE